MTGAEKSNPTPGTQIVKQPVENKKILVSPKIRVDKARQSQDTPTEREEEETLKKNTKANSEKGGSGKKLTVGFVASTIRSEESNVSTGSAYGLTAVDSSKYSNRQNPRVPELTSPYHRRRIREPDPDPVLEQLHKDYERLRREHHRPTGVTFHEPPAKLRRKLFGRFCVYQRNEKRVIEI